MTQHSEARGARALIALGAAGKSSPRRVRRPFRPARPDRKRPRSAGRLGLRRRRASPAVGPWTPSSSHWGFAREGGGRGAREDEARARERQLLDDAAQQRARAAPPAARARAPLAAEREGPSAATGATLRPAPAAGASRVATAPDAAAGCARARRRVRRRPRAAPEQSRIGDRRGECGPLERVVAAGSRSTGTGREQFFSIIRERASDRSAFCRFTPKTAAPCANWPFKDCRRRRGRPRGRARRDDRFLLHQSKEHHCSSRRQLRVPVRHVSDRPAWRLTRVFRHSLVDFPQARWSRTIIFAAGRSGSPTRTPRSSSASATRCT